MICPYCEKEMTRGYVAGLSGITFSEEYRRVSLYVRKGDISIAKFTGCVAHKAAWLCENCRMVIMKNIPEPAKKREFSGEVEDLSFE